MDAPLLYGSVLLAALANATWNGLLKNSGDRLLTMAAMRVVGIVVGLVVALFVPPPNAETWMWLIAATFTHFVYFALLLESYRIGEMSLVYPIARGLPPLLLAAAGLLLGQDRLNIGQSAGIVLVAVGILILAFGAGGSRRAVGFAVTTSMSIAVYLYCGGMGARAGASVVATWAWLEILTSAGLLMFVPFKRSWADTVAFATTSWRNGLIAGVIAILGYLAYLNAATSLPLAAVAAVRESSVIFGAIIGVIAFKESFGARRILAALLVTAGIVALGIFSRPQ